VVSPPPHAIHAHGSMRLTATVLNDGSSRAYGYATGIYAGQVRVGVRIIDAGGRVRSEQDLYLDRSLEPGQRATAVGDVRLPAQRGTYTLLLEPRAVGCEACTMGKSVALSLKVS